MSPLNQLVSGIFQVVIVLLISVLVWFLSKKIFKNSNSRFLDYLGLKFQRKQFDSKFFFILVGMIAFGSITTFLQFEFSEEMKTMLLSDSSPYYKALKNGFGLSAVLSGLIYCVVNSGLAEELLFRGLIAPRFVSRLGFLKGNVVQAFLFWFMHLLIFKGVTGDWISTLQMMVFFLSFPVGLLMVFVNYRNEGFSIYPSWILHSSANFATFISVAICVN